MTAATATTTPELSVNLAGLRLANPTLTCSGTCGNKGRDLSRGCRSGVGGGVLVAAFVFPAAGRSGQK